MVNIAPKFWGFNDVIVSSTHAIRLMLVIGRSGFSVYHFKVIM
jgi:hypothetical protein